MFIAAAINSVVVGSENKAAKKSVEFFAEAVSSKTLENGLVIITKDCDPADLVSIHIKIMAGSSLEGRYLGTGVSHLVEHMLFKGTSSRQSGEIEKEIKSYGGFINGSTSQDITDYNVTIPAAYLERALEILKDMLKDASFLETEFSKEKEVIAGEMRLVADDPGKELVRLLYQTSYMRHPYKYPPIGYESLFKNISREDALSYYRKMYVPNNMVVSIVGGVDESDAMLKAQKIFSDMGKPDYDALGPSIIEPPQIMRRDALKEMDINIAYMGIGFHSTRLLDEDLFAMDVLAMILGRGDNSRLNMKLVKKESLAHSISCWNYTPRDPGLFVIIATLDPEGTDRVTESILEEIRHLKKGDFEDTELETAKRMVVADYIFQQQSIDEQSSVLASDYALTGSYDFSRRYVEGISKITKEDLRRAASAYLTDQNMTIVKIVPLRHDLIPRQPSAVITNKQAAKEVTLPNGLRLILHKDAKTPTISITAAISGGVSAEDSDTNGISNLASRLILKGTSSRKEAAIRGAIESLGGSISPFSSLDSFGVNISVLKPDLTAALDVLEDILTRSIFPEVEVEKEKKLIAAQIKQEDDDVFNRGFQALRRELFTGTPYALRILGEADSVARLKRDDIADFYFRRLNAGDTVISISGDIDEIAAEELLRKAFSGIKKMQLDKTVINVPKIEKVKIVDIEMEREQSLVVLGFQTVRADDPDRYALDVLNSVLSGVSGRLFTVLRDESPMAYILGSFQRLARRCGFLALYVATSPDRVEKARKALIDEIKKVRSFLVGDDEIDMAKRELKTNFDIAMQSNAFFSHNSAIDELNGLGADNLYRYKEAIGRVTAEDLSRVAKKYFKLDSYAEVTINPH